MCALLFSEYSSVQFYFFHSVWVENAEFSHSIFWHYLLKASHCVYLMENTSQKWCFFSWKIWAMSIAKALVWPFLLHHLGSHWFFANALSFSLSWEGSILSFFTALIHLKIKFCMYLEPNELFLPIKMTDIRKMLSKNLQSF